MHRGSVSIIVYDTKQAVYGGIEYVHPAFVGDLGASTSPIESSLACTCLQTTPHMTFVCCGLHAGAHLGVIISVLKNYQLPGAPQQLLVIGCNGSPGCRTSAGYSPCGIRVVYIDTAASHVTAS